MKTVFCFAGKRTQRIAATVVLLHALAWAGNPRPFWTIDLEKHDFRTFQTQINLTWSKQQNVVFLASGRLIIYQVNQLAEPARLSARNTSGGAGNFFLEIRVLDVRDGHLIQALRLPTSAGFSGIFPTQHGKLVVRTGETLRLCTQEFQTLVSRKLPLESEDPIEVWQTGISPSGGHIALVHEKATPSAMLITDEEATSEIEILDADTLKTVKKFSIPQRISPWSAGDGFLVTADPGHVIGERRFGFLDFEGNWTALAVQGDKCNYHLNSLGSMSLAARGCGRLAVVSTSGEKLFTRNVASHDAVGSVRRSGRYLAMELDHQIMGSIPGVNFPIMVPKPERLELYDLDTKKRLLSLAVKSKNLYYAISDNGTLAVIEGSTLAVYRTEN